MLRRLFFFISLLTAVACGKDTVAPQIPYVPVNEQLNLTNIQYNQLRRDNGYVYINGGLRGLIVIRQNANHYLAIERTCSYKPADACALVSVDPSGLFLKCGCCNSQFDLTGRVTGGPAAYPLRLYGTSLNGNLLYINN
ncbi:Rieske 2Fe-2S domain-containing protein [Adhaeribacter aquaticus]|uniref:Rieske 2Fe-2S domain-containing protein n=1 Tax=Adhaeribacter aquaticus TaxID=299567 RepID=UPI0004065FC4|nr:Rieske 2Fe-2S domain-containing protein [Adhaeribacter aquaticus]